MVRLTGRRHGVVAILAHTAIHDALWWLRREPTGGCAMLRTLAFPRLLHSQLQPPLCGGLSWARFHVRRSKAAHLCGGLSWARFHVRRSKAASLCAGLSWARLHETAEAVSYPQVK